MLLIGIDPGVRKAEPWSIKTGKYKKENRLVITCGCGVIFKRYRFELLDNPSPACKSCVTTKRNKERRWSDNSKEKVSKANKGRLSGYKNPNYSAAFQEFKCMYCEVCFVVANNEIKNGKKRGKYCSEPCYQAHKKITSLELKGMRAIRNRLSSSISRRIRAVIGNKKDGAHWPDILGYSYDDLKNHLESRFKEGMTWSNYGVFGWHIDHIKPISSFDIKDIGDQSLKDCWSLENLQPLWCRDNWSKGGMVA